MWPAYQSYKTLQQQPPVKDQQEKWLAYWFAIVNCAMLAFLVVVLYSMMLLCLGLFTRMLYLATNENAMVFLIPRRPLRAPSQLYGILSLAGS